MTDPQPAIDLRQVGVRRGDRWILRDASLTVPAGSLLALLGPNGSGKSTLARLLAGYVWPTAGAVCVLGHRFGEANLNALRRHVRLIQPHAVHDPDAAATARDVVLTGFFGTVDLRDAVSDEQRRQADRELHRVGLSTLTDRTFHTLSTGERMRCMLARALVTRPGLLILDEPTAGLDLVGREQFLATLDRLTRGDAHRPTIVLVTHHVEELPAATTAVALLDGGALAAAGAPEQVLRAEVLSVVYRCPVEVTRTPAGRYFATASPGS
ncbi:MAG TPA: ATP-binding cassette domain-containing protein [Tepidisphaeraceae bacterium]|nr:ATP-binding cassette domain-containing protein [Tepidisphaeraceae bacterium]